MNKIIRVKAEKGFTIINNAVFHAGLSARSMGLLCYILHLPEDWTLYKTYLYEKLPEGREAIQTAWKELEQKGFIVTKKEEGGGRGKLPETSYFVYDSPQLSADFRAPETRQPNNRQPKTRLRKTRTLQSTNEQSTIEQSTKEESTNEQQKPGGFAPAQDKEPEPGPVRDPEPETKQRTVFQRFTDAYDAWYKKLNGVPPKYDKGSGQATKLLVAYFQKIATDRAKTDGQTLTAQQIDDRAVEAWEYIFRAWHKIDGFLQTKTRLVDINSNISNIITQLKNGHSKKTGQQPTGGNVPTSNLVGAIAKHYSGNGAGQPGPGH